MRSLRLVAAGSGLLVLAWIGPASGQVGAMLAPGSGGIENLARAASDSADSAAATIPDTIRYRGNELDYDARNRQLVLSGEARLEYRSTILSADTVYYDQSTGALVAAGSPDITDPSLAPFQGDRLRYNLKTKLGVLRNGRSEQNGDFYRGAEIRRNPDRSLEVLDGDFCQCKGKGDPDYWFSSGRMAIDPEERAVAAPVVLNIAEVPVFVAPFVMFPLGKGRRSGLLAPKLGGDQRQGFYARNVGAYWGISDYADLLGSADLVEGERGRFDQASATAQLRYARRYWLDGNVSWKEHLQEFGSKGSGWEARYVHDQQLTPEPGKATLKGEGAFVSSSTIRSETALSTEEILDQTANANLQLQYRWKQASATMSLMQESNLTTGLRKRELPALSLQSSGQLWKDEENPEPNPFLQSLRYSYQVRTSRYEDKEPDALADSTARPDVLTYAGATQTASVTASQTFLDHLRMGASFNAQHDWTWNSYDADPVAGETWRPFHPDRYDPDQSLRWNTGVTAATDIYGVWLPYWGRFGGLRHTLTPTTGYTFFPHIDERTMFVANPRLGQQTRQDRAQLVTMGLGQKLDAKILGERGDSARAKAPKGTAYSLVSLSTNTSYDLEKDVRPWNPIVTSYNTGLLQAVDLNGSFVHSLYDRFSGDSTTERFPILESWSIAFSKSLAVSGSLSDGVVSDTTGSPWNANLGYSYSLRSERVSRDVFRSTRVQSMSVGAGLHPTRAWDATWRSIYNFDEGTFVSHDLSFRRPLGCWDLTFGWVPVGPARGWNFLIVIRDVPDIKLQATSTTIRKIRNPGAVQSP